MLRYAKVLVLVILFTSCSSKIHVLKTDFARSPTPPKPDYTKQEHWASLPTKRDAADSIPKKSNLKNLQATAPADVFFIYPTIFINKPLNQFSWNADVNDAVLNNQIQLSTILNQASVFNGVGRVYSPYYRQAHLYAFYTPNKLDGTNALNLAYEDVKDAFEHYLKNYNQGRPIIIASHSQGSYHGERLLKDYFDGKELQTQLVAAYLIGRAIKPTAFANIKPTEKPDEVGVWASWNTFGRGFFPKNYNTYYKGSLSINPLLWNSSEAFATKELNKGGVATKFTFAPEIVDAQNHQSILWVHRPNIKGSWLVKNKSWHRADMNFFYVNIRENAALRVAKFLEKEKSTTANP
jgi:Protein of unknown function (DUF3089)